MHRGVGLALVHRLVTRVGGTITASSPDGARFDVTMPIRVGPDVQAVVREGVS
jgi:two-component system CitB family sensor kinase